MEVSEHLQTIKTDEDVDILVSSILSRNRFANKFVFDDERLVEKLFSALNISVEDFEENDYYLDLDSGLHISWSEEGFFWISTVGLVPMGKLSTNNYINAFASQVWVIRTLLAEAERICSFEQVWDIDSYFNEKLKSISIAVSWNLVFYSELFCKTYLSISQKGDKEIPHIHRLSRLMDEVESVMYEMGHNNTLFHGLVLPFFKENVRELQRFPSGYREEFMKYDDNKKDYDAVLLLNPSIIRAWQDEIRISNDFIMEYYYEGDKSSYLETGLYQRLLEQARTPEERERIKRKKSFLIEKRNKQTE